MDVDQNRRTNRPASGGRSPLPAVGFVLACLCLDPRGRAAADGVRGGVTVGTRVDDSSTETSETEGLSGLLTPFLFWSRRGAGAEIDLEARRRYDSTRETRSFQPAVDLVKLGIARPTGGLSTWSLGGRYHKTSDLVANDPNVVVVPGTTETGTLNAAVALQRAEAAWQMESRSRSAPGAGDGWFQNATATLLPLRTPTTAWLVRGGYENWTIDDSEALRATSVTTGYRREHRPGFATEAEVGVSEVRDFQAGTDDTRATWGVAATGFAGLLGLALDSRLQVAYEVTTTGALDLGRSISGMSLTVHAERALESEGGVFTSPVLKDFAEVAIADTVAGTWTGGFEVSHARTRVYVGEGPEIETSRASLTVGHRLHHWLTAQASLGYFRQAETQGSQVDRYHRGRVEVGLTAAFQ